MELTIQRQLGPRRNHCGRWLVGCPSCSRLVGCLFGWDRSTRLAARDMAARWIPEILRRERAQGHAVPALGLPTRLVLAVPAPGGDASGQLVWACQRCRAWASEANGLSRLQRWRRLLRRRYDDPYRGRCRPHEGWRLEEARRAKADLTLLRFANRRRLRGRLPERDLWMLEAVRGSPPAERWWSKVRCRARRQC
jgi:hypothetical protein